MKEGWISGTGQFVAGFERALSQRICRAETIAVVNGTIALELALRVLCVGPGAEVIVPALTFAAPAMSVLAVGAVPVIADVSEDSWTISPSDAEAKITRRTAAIIAVDVLGHPADYDRLKFGLPVIQDSAEAHGATYCDRPVGSQGDISVFSFHANKAITTGEGGAASTDSSDLASRMRLIAHHGMTRDRPYVHEVVGRNYQMTNLAAAVGLGQLSRWDELIGARNDVSVLYDQLLDGAPCGHRPVAAWAGYACWLYCVTVANREQVLNELRSSGIDARAIWPSLTDQPVLRGLGAVAPVAEYISRQALWLPTYAGITEDEQRVVAEHLRLATMAA